MNTISANKVYRGSLPDRVFKEMAEVSNLPLRPGETSQIDYRANDYRKGIRFNGDVDRVTGASLELNTRTTLTGNSRYNLDVTAPDGSQQSLPTSLDQVRDVALDYRNRQAAVLMPAGDQWQIQRFDLDQETGFFSSARGQVLAEFGGQGELLDYAADGSLLISQGNEIKKVEAGALLPYLSFPARVRNFGVLSDGGLCVQLENGNCSRSDYYYVKPDGSEALRVSQADLGLMEESRFYQPAGFIKKMSPQQREQFAESVPVGKAWWDRWGIEDVSSPDGQYSAGFTKEGIYGRQGLTDLGQLFACREDSAGGLFASFGVDQGTATWTAGGRMFGVLSGESGDSLSAARDAWVWDPASRQGMVIPSVLKMQAQPDGRFLLNLPGQKKQLVSPEELGGIAQQSWFQELAGQPRILRDYRQVVSQSSDGTRLTLIKDAREHDRLVATADSRYLISIDKQGRSGQLWDATSGLQIKLPPLQHCYWDEERDILGIVHEDGHYEAYNSEQIHNSSWFRKSIQEYLGVSSPAQPAPPVQVSSGAVSIGGLAMPKKARKS
ncbi:hypothetical protein JST97_11570 [bacterium]|nr:hypothetical protein [bacterium]